MQWALLLLSGRPKLQDQLFDGIKDLSPEETTQHPLLKSVLRETLRLYPVAPFLTRYLMTDSLIGDYFVKKEVIGIRCGANINTSCKINEVACCNDLLILRKKNRYISFIVRLEKYFEFLNHDVPYGCKLNHSF